MNLAEDSELLADAAGAVIAVDQFAKGLESKDHTVSHLSKAAVSAAVAIGAYELLRRQQELDEKHHHDHRHHHNETSPTREVTYGPHEHHLVKEIIGAYGLGKS